jgi:hypothetical protein
MAVRGLLFLNNSKPKKGDLMTAMVQSVIKKITEVTLKNASKKLTLYISMLLSSKERKNYASMARENNFSYKQVYVDRKHAAQYAAECKQFLIDLVKDISKKSDDDGYIVIDFSLLEKLYSQKIPFVTYDYNGAKKQVSKGFSIGFVFWSNGKVTIPLDYYLWIRKKEMLEGYKTKIEIAQELLLSIKAQGIPVKEVLMDGAFASEGMIKFLKANGIHFTMRIPTNRVIQTKNEKNQLAKHSELRMKGNERYKTVQGSYKGEEHLFFTAHKRNGKNDTKEVVFIVSDAERKPKEHVQEYDDRWPAEKYFRSSKQHIGISQCQSTDSDKQEFHIFSVMVSYAILQCIKYDKKKQSVEEVIHDIRRRKIIHPLLDYIDLEQTFMS